MLSAASSEDGSEVFVFEEESFGASGKTAPDASPGLFASILMYSVMRECMSEMEIFKFVDVLVDGMIADDFKSGKVLLFLVDWLILLTLYELLIFG